VTTEKPNLPDTKITEFLYDSYGLQVVEVGFLPIGYEYTAVYRVVTGDGTPYFLKLKRDIFDETSVTVPMFLRDHGVRQIIAPVATRSHQRWTRLDDFHVILYPFVEGHNAFKAPLTETQWADFGAALHSIHNAVLSPELRSRIPQETYSSQWRDTVKVFLVRAQHETFDDPIAAQFAAFLTSKADELHYLVQRAEQLGAALLAQNPTFVLCHSDVHAGNLLIDANDNLYIVDWDNPILAPKERDLMFIGGGIGGNWNSAQEEALFYKGYGQVEINPVALAYYRFERIVQDFASFSPQLLLAEGSRTDRERTLHGTARFFESNGVMERAYKAEKDLPLEFWSNTKPC